MTALPSIHALRAIHDALASIHQKQGGLINQIALFTFRDICDIIYTDSIKIMLW
jgi:hypothetical protein